MVIGIFYGNLVYFMVIWSILQLFGIFLLLFSKCYGHLVYFMVIWYLSISPFGKLYRKNLATLASSYLVRPLFLVFVAAKNYFAN
jgi:hypothetical protein